MAVPMQSPSPRAATPAEPAVAVAPAAPPAVYAAPRALQRCLCRDDFEPAARARLPRPLFGYVSGATETNADFVWLGRSPAEVFVAMAGVPIGYDDEGGEAKCAITSKLRRGPADTIEVIYGGSWNGRATYLKTGRQFEPTDKLDLSAKCPGAEPG